MMGRAPEAVWAGLLAAALGLASCGPSAPEPPPEPVATVHTELDCRGCNVVFVSIDALRADHLSLHGYSRPTSPQIDAFAGEAIVFDNAFSASRKTAPSHMSMFTGLYPTVHEVYMTQVSDDGKPSLHRLDDRVPLLAEVLRDAGYQTMGWHGGGHVSAAYGFERGFDRYQHVDSHRRARDLVWPTRHDGEWDAALAWLDQRDERPFFLFLHTYAVHDPYQPAEPYYSMWKGDYRGGIRPASGHSSYWDNVDKDDPQDVARLVSLYDGAIRYTSERLVAPLVDALRSRGLLERTIVVLTSDHGEEFGEHGQFIHEQLYEEILHVPLLVYLPPAIAPSAPPRRIAAQVSTVDLMPTLLDLLGVVSARERLQGRSLVPLLTGRAGGDRLVYAVGVRGPWYGRAPRAFHALRWGGYKLIHDPDQPVTELYDIRVDPGERNDLGAGAGRAFHAMVALLDEVRSRNDRFKLEQGYRSSPEEYPEETLEQLRALGYLE